MSAAPSGLRVIAAGPLSLVQDAGRFGWQHLGVSPSGPLDRQAAAWANRLLDNPWGTPLLEIALGGLELESQVDTWVAVCGAELPIALDGQARPCGSSFAWRAGQRLRLGYARRGQRAYLAVAGGFAMTPVLGSVATQCREGLGGLRGDGARLQAGDLLPCAAAERPRATRVPPAFVRPYGDRAALRVMLGGDAPSFDADQLAQLFAQSWTLSPQSDRMGARLQGQALQAPVRQWSQGLVTGSIQVPPDGQPIILLADRQSMGGYPVLGWVHPLDLDRLAQLPAHGQLTFSPVEVQQVQAELRTFYRFFGR
ncbi:MAG: biotin-dependent carboxyltransferase family protein [Pseudomonas sp.]|uniref:5-oxoprolinase subunit C family protein n=1 Tax=Pseudomonas sp. TaxID=306 RepID=UPI0033988D9E